MGFRDRLDNTECVTQVTKPRAETTTFSRERAVLLEIPCKAPGGSHDREVQGSRLSEMLHLGKPEPGLPSWPRT